MADHGGRSRRRWSVLGAALLGLAGLLTIMAVVVTTRAAPGSSRAPRSAATAASTTTAVGDVSTLVALGDSVPSADTCGCRSYVAQVGDRLEAATHVPWVVHNDATGGWTTADVESDLRDPTTRTHLAQADLVLIEAGANDLDLDRVDDSSCAPVSTSSCWTSQINGIRDGLIHIIDGIHRIDRRPDLRIALVGYWNVTLDGAVGRARGPNFVTGSDQLTRLVNTSVEHVATTSGAVYVDAYTPLKGEADTRDPTPDLLADGDHLSASGHTLLAGAVIHTLGLVGAIAAWPGGGG